MLNPLYVFESLFGSDIVRNITEFTQNPFIESRITRVNAILNELDKVYDTFSLYTKREIKELYNDILKIQKKGKDISEIREDILEIHEDISDLYDELKNVSDYELMKFKPRVCTKFVLEKHLMWYFNDSKHYTVAKQLYNECLHLNLM